MVPSARWGVGYGFCEMLRLATQYLTNSGCYNFFLYLFRDLELQIRAVKNFSRLIKKALQGWESNWRLCGY